MTVENSVALNTPSSSVTYYTANQNGRGFVLSVEPAAAVSSTNFATAAVFSSKNSSILDLKTTNKEIDKARLATVKKLWDITEQMNILYPENWTRIAAQELAKFQEQMVSVLVKEWSKTNMYDHSAALGFNKDKNSLAPPTSATKPSASKSSLSVKSKRKTSINKQPEIQQPTKGGERQKIRYTSFKYHVK